MSVYWKVGIGLPDVDLGREKIMAKNTQVTEGHQFQVIVWKSTKNNLLNDYLKSC